MNTHEKIKNKLSVTKKGIGGKQGVVCTRTTICYVIITDEKEEGALFSDHVLLHELLNVFSTLTTRSSSGYTPGDFVALDVT